MLELFQSILSKAKDHSRSLMVEISSMEENIREYKKSILDCEQYINQIQTRVKQISPHIPYFVFEDTDHTRYRLWRSSTAGKNQREHKRNLFSKYDDSNERYIADQTYFCPIIVYSADSPAFHHLLTSWGLAVQHLKELIEEAEKEIKLLQKEKDEIDYWILEKETRWNSLTKELLDEQLTQIVKAGDYLSRLLLDRNVKLQFEYQDGGNPAHVSTSFKERDKVFLSVEVIGNQPRKVVDLFKGLILHELGHFLLHLGDTAKEYRKFQSLLRKKITVAPDFYTIFNIILDEQLERVLRDRTREWQAWFNRLTFYLRTIQAFDLKKRLQNSKYPEKGLADIDFSELIDKGWVKTYQDENFPSVAILSAEFLTEEYGFKRLEAFFYSLRGRLPGKSVTQKWLQFCLDQIPSDFKTLDIYELHRLAVRIYRIITEDLQAKKLAMVTIKINDKDIIELPVPDLTGTPFVGQKKDDDRFYIDISGKEGNRDGKKQVKSRLDTTPPSLSRSQSFRNITNPEGEPEPPKVKERDEISRPIAPDKPKKKRGKSGGGGIALHAKRGNFRIRGSVNFRQSPAWANYSGSGSGSGSGNNTNKGTGNKAKKKTKGAKGENNERLSGAQNTWRSKAQKAQQESTWQPPVNNSPLLPDALKNKTPKTTPDTRNELSEQKKKLTEHLNKKLEKIKESLKAEQAGVFENSRMTREGGKTSDFKNTNSTKLFPDCEKIIRLKTDSLQMKKLQLRSKRYVQWLRPSLSRIDQVKQMQLKQSAGKSMMSSAVKNFIIYGEPQIFRNLKSEDIEEYSDVHISFLLDTSASMQTDERMNHAKILVSLFAECLTDCPGISTAIYAYNQNLYLCGDHENYSVAQLEPSGKTNEAAALYRINRDLETIARPIKLVIVVTDGLPTACSVEAVKWQVAEMETKYHVQFIGCVFSKEDHPAYKHHIDFSGGTTRASVMKLGKRLGYML